MANCKHCGRPLILNGGKCAICGADPNEAPQSNAGKQVGGKSRPIVQRKTFATRDWQSPYSQYTGQSIIPGVKNDRFVVNCAAWLTNIERFGYHPE